MPHANINNANLWYTITGQGEPLFLHHGYTASRVNWLPVAEILKDKYQIILMECRGTGESEHTKDGYSLGQFSEDVIALADHLKFDKFSFAGHSMGGGIAYLLGLNHPERLNKLILMAPIPSSGIATMPSEGYIERRLKARKENNRDYFMQELLAGRFREDVQSDAWFESRVDHVLGVSEAHLLECMQSMFDLNVEAQLPELNLPTLMLAGAIDGLLPANLKDFQALPDASLHVFSRAGHDVAVHEPEGVSEAIDSFMTFGPMSASKLSKK